MQTALSRTWTWVTDSISYDDHPYAKCASYIDWLIDFKGYFIPRQSCSLSIYIHFVVVAIS